MYISRDECQTVIEKALKIEEKADSVTMKVQAGIIADIMIDAQTGYDVSICQVFGLIPSANSTTRPGSIRTTRFISNVMVSMLISAIESPVLRVKASTV